MKPKLLLLTLLLALTLTACTPTPSEPESSSVPTSPSQVAEQSSAPWAGGPRLPRLDGRGL